jgi:glucuronokinase
MTTTASERVTARATVLARTGLVGHPSDGYGGATLAVTLRNFAAEVRAAPAPALDIAPATDGQWPEGGQPLVAATVAHFRRHCERLDEPFDGRAAIRFASTIPREVGLGGSSAIVIATLRALSAMTGVRISRDRLPTLALAIETEGLGIAAGLQDRVVQANGGLVFMDFLRDRYESLDEALLPPLFVAWLPGAGGASGRAHRAVRARFERGEPDVIGAMATLARLAHEARAALLVADHAAFAGALDAGYDVRAAIFELDLRHTSLIERARALGLSATYTGSGGAIVGIASDADAVAALARASHDTGVRVVEALVGANAAPATGRDQAGAQARSSGSGSIG